MAGEHAPMGANLTHDGATFRIWAPSARSVTLKGSFDEWTPRPLQRQTDGYWFTAVQGAREGDEYKFFIDGTGTTGHKRDPYGRARTWTPAYPSANNIITQPASFPWHDATYRTPAFNDVVLYQLHVGAFFSADAQGHDVRAQRPGRFLDVLYKLEYLVELGVTALQLLPIQEFETMRSLGYNGTDYFAPELDYTIHPLSPDFQRYVDLANSLLANKGHAPYQQRDLECQTKQLMALVDLCHVYGIAVIFDVVYNHAGGDFGDESIHFLDRQPPGDNNRSLYFTDQGWAGGLIFAYWQRPVCAYLIDNAGLFLDQYHADGFRFDEVTVIDKNNGWHFLQDLTDTLRHKKPEALLIAEYWADQRAALLPRNQGGAGFDAVVESGLRGAVRDALAQATGGADARVSLDAVAQQLRADYGATWRRVTHLENHDIVRVNNTNDRQPRIAALASGGDARSWYTRSRARWANGLLLTAPGTPMLFMGQEFLEDKYWSDSPDHFASSLLWWDGLDRDAAMRDHLRFVRELIALRLQTPGLRGDGLNVFHVHNDNRVLAFHRWMNGVGGDVVVAANLREETWWDYELGFPWAGEWREAFNSDVYDHWVNPLAAGNRGNVQSIAVPRHGLNASAHVVLPANSVLVFVPR